MIAVILPPGPSQKMYGLDAEHSLALLPLGDRPILQHIVESLVGQGITSIEVILEHAPEKIEALLGNGDRWGCRFRYHLAAQPDLPYRSLRVIEKTKDEPWVLIHADRYPYAAFAGDLIAKPVLYYGFPNRNVDQLDNASGAEPRSIDGWGGTAVFPAGDFGQKICDKTFDELQAYLQHTLSTGESDVVHMPDWIDATTPDSLLDSQARLLDGSLKGMMVSGIERQPGVWISRNVEIHPTAVITPPVYIGPNCRINRGVRLGPDVVISGGCIVDSHTVIDQSLAMAGSYIGEGLELSRAIVNHNLLVNTRLGTKVDINESFLLGGLKPRARQGWLARAAQSVLAVAMIVFFSPVLLLSLLYFVVGRRISCTSIQMATVPMEPGDSECGAYSLPCLGCDAWKVHRPAGWSAFTRQFLPGLFAVVAGRIGLVGLPPKSIGELERLPHEWRVLYTRAGAGLVTESAIAATDAGDDTQLYLADAYYSARRSLLHDVSLAARYMLRLVMPMRSRSS